MLLITLLILLLPILVLVGGSKNRSKAIRLASIGCFLLIILFLAAEGAIRCHDGLRYGSWWPDAAGVHELSPFRAHAARPGYRRYDGSIQHNAQGFRRRDETTQSKGDGLRVFFCGGSAAYGTGSSYAWDQPQFEAIDNESTIDQSIEKTLGTRLDTPVEVINAAVAEYRVHQHLIYLFETILSYDPDVVVFYDGFNDLELLDSIDRFHRTPLSSQAQYDIINDPTPLGAGKLLLTWLKNQSALIHRVGTWYRLYAIHRRMESTLGNPVSPKPLSQEEQDTVLARTGDDYLRYARLITSLCRENGVTPVFAVQPVLLADTTKPLNAWETKYRDYEIAAGTDRDFKSRSLAAFTGRLETFCREQSVPFLDLTQPFGGMSQQAYADYCHLTPEGNRVIGEKIAVFLGDTVLKGAEEP